VAKFCGDLPIELRDLALKKERKRKTSAAKHKAAG